MNEIFSAEFKALVFLIFLSNAFSCATPVEKLEPKEIEKPVIQVERKIPTVNHEKKWQRPKALEKVNLSSLKKHTIPQQVLATENFLWLIYYDHVDIYSPEGVKTFHYKSFKEKNRRVPRLIVYGDGSEYWGRPRGIWHHNSEVIMCFDHYDLYHFKEDGTFTKKKERTEEWWELKQGEYAKYNWTAEFDNSNYLLFGHRKPIEGSNRKTPRKKIRVSRFIFSGPWVLLQDFNRSESLLKLVLLDRRTAENIEEFKYFKRDRGIKVGYDFRVHQKGFYIDHLTDEYRTKVWPVRWFGEKIINLNHGPDVFCYVFKGEKKCIDNADHKLTDVVETENYRVLQTKDALYIEGLPPAENVNDFDEGIPVPSFEESLPVCPKGMDC